MQIGGAKSLDETQATKRDLRMACDSSIRGDFDPVSDMFIEKQFLASCEDGDDPAQRFRLAA
jgi:hypothetical protein